MNDDNRCVCCGASIPEGRQICPECEKGRESCEDTAEQFSGRR